MIAIKCKISNLPDIDDYIRQYGNCMRFAYNRFCDGDKLGEVYHKTVKEVKNCELLNASLREFAVFEANDIFKRVGKGVIFGGRKAFNKLKWKKEGAEKVKKNKYFYAIGRSGKFKGNRAFNFDFENNKVTFKPSKSVKIDISFNCNSKNHLRILKAAETLAKRGLTSITVKFSKENIIFIVDETIIKKENQFIKNRVLSIDSNPQFIGVAISDFKNGSQKIVHREIFNLKGLEKENKNKRAHEIFEISKRIAEIAAHYKCQIVGVEDITKKSREHSKGKRFNRLVNNLWNRKRFFESLEKWCNIYSIRYLKIAPQYSSFIGAALNPNEPDMVAAAIEIGRRTYLFNKTFIDKILPNTGEKVEIVFPKFDLNLLPTRWKEMVKGIDGLSDWKKLFSFFKKSKMSYRFLFYDWCANVNSFRFKSDFSLIRIYSY